MAEYKLKVLNESYREGIIRAKLMQKTAGLEAEALQLAIDETKKLMKGVSDVVDSETQGYFKSTSLPSISKNILKG
ncbi:MAG: hypothetical protein MI976_08610 [Pseudomonadales bacterium]|nr:hypothetical protein [Pseudomonadales bacterium]